MPLTDLIRSSCDSHQRTARLFRDLAERARNERDFTDYMRLANKYQLLANGLAARLAGKEGHHA